MLEYTVLIPYLFFLDSRRSRQFIKQEEMGWSIAEFSPLLKPQETESVQIFFVRTTRARSGGRDLPGSRRTT